jgi:CMP-N-acetylneuraminic acid synthetase
MTVLAVIPARGGSKGVIGKNLQSVGGISLVGRAVRCCFEAGCIDRILVSTDDPCIRAEALLQNAEVPFLRPAELATDTASTVDAVLHAVNTYEAMNKLRVTVLVLVEPTNPFRSPKSLRIAIEHYCQGGWGSVIGVCPLDRKPEFIFQKKENERLKSIIKEPELRFSRRQDMVKLCRLSNVVYVVGRDDFERERSFVLDPLGYVNNTQLEALNIDEELDLEFARFIASTRNI